jgi:hypothetical protein
MVRPPPAGSSPGATSMLLKLEMAEGMLEAVEEVPDR